MDTIKQSAYEMMDELQQSETEGICLTRDYLKDKYNNLPKSLFELVMGYSEKSDEDKSEFKRTLNFMLNQISKVESGQKTDRDASREFSEKISRKYIPEEYLK